MIKINEIIKKNGEYYKRISLPTVKKYIKSLSDNSFMELFLVGNKVNIYSYWTNFQYIQISNLKELEREQNVFYYYNYGYGNIQYYLQCNSKGDIYLNKEAKESIKEV